MNVNVVALTGNLTRDPEQFADGKVTKFGMAVNEREKQGEEWVDRASFFDVVCFGKQGDNVQQYLSKGSPVAVQGRLRQERWEKDGQNRSKVTITAERVQFLRGGDVNGEQSSQPDLGVEQEQPPPTAGEPSANGHDPGSVPDTPENIQAHCICRPGAISDKCPIEKHGIPF